MKIANHHPPPESGIKPAATGNLDSIFDSVPKRLVTFQNFDTITAQPSNHDLITSVIGAVSTKVAGAYGVSFVHGKSGAETGPGVCIPVSKNLWIDFLEYWLPKVLDLLQNDQWEIDALGFT